MPLATIPHIEQQKTIAQMLRMFYICIQKFVYNAVGKQVIYNKHFLF